ncbi:MAG TPA: HAD family phosphatase [Mycobacteriales bacterium]|nr:HAD family phosphatase [Mycobacteriales bacterium]
MTAEPDLVALIVDYGGVLTNGLAETMAAWCTSDGIDAGEFERAMREWLGPGYGADAELNPVHALERGELAIPDFERQLATRLTARGGRPVRADGLLTRMFAAFQLDPRMLDVVRRCHRAGIRTALLSNSWGLDYPRDGWPELFDVTVISGEVGMRKPEPDIYRLTADRLGVQTTQCVFVDDLAPNVRGAVTVGMVGIQHHDAAETSAELEELFGIRFGPAPDAAADAERDTMGPIGDGG